MSREEEERAKALLDKLEGIAEKYKAKYQAILEEAERETEEARIEADIARREAEIARREAEIEHQKALKLCEETRRSTARIRTATNREVPDGTIGGIVKTEWGTFLNIAQTPS